MNLITTVAVMGNLVLSMLLLSAVPDVDEDSILIFVLGLSTLFLNIYLLTRGNTVQDIFSLWLEVRKKKLKDQLKGSDNDN